jgi:CelD/BcsL family acetyltransferase involved in cellulose biosynthesis
VASDVRRLTAVRGSLAILDAGDARWRDLVDRDPNALAFHHASWVGVLADCYGFRPMVLGVVDGDELRAGLPVLDVRHAFGGRRWISLPFTDHCPVVGAGNVDAHEFAAALAATRVAHGIPRLEVRTPLPGGHRVEHAVLHRLSLRGGFDAVYGRTHRSQVQRNVRRAEREGVEVERGTDAGLLDAFYRLHVQTRRRLGVPVQSRRYFRLLHERVIEPGLGFVSVARVDGQPVAAAVFLTFNGTLIYKYGASATTARRTRGTHLVFWDAIRWGCAAEHRTLDFGLSGFDDRGLRAFKSNWGAVETRLVHTVFADAPPATGSGRALRAAGVVIKHSPPIVTRALGTFFYRYGA